MPDAAPPMTAAPSWPARQRAIGRAAEPARLWLASPKVLAGPAARARREPERRLLRHDLSRHEPRKMSGQLFNALKNPAD